jgi:hypothetical protein
LQTLENLFLRLVQHAQEDEARFPKIYLFITDRGWTSEGIRLITKTYPVEAQIMDVFVQGEELPETTKDLISKHNSLVIIKPWMEPQLMRRYEGILRELGKSPCDITATNGDKRFVLWHSPEAAYLCER